MRIQLIKKNIFALIFQIIALFIAGTVYSQQIKDYKTLLDERPYFVDHQVVPADSLFLRDVDILKHLGSFDNVDLQLLKGNVLKEIMAIEMEKGRTATYRTIIDFMIDYKKTPAYKDFVDGVLLYKELENKKVDVKNWELDKSLFIKLGFVQSDLDDFKDWITKEQNSGLTYKEAYIRYMKEIEAMTAPTPVKRD